MSFTVIILAAGKGRRMHSDTPKVMHKIAGVSMLGHIVNTVAKIEADSIKIVASEELLAHPDIDSFKKNKKISFVTQKDRTGTASAVKCVLEQDSSINQYDKVLILNGDTPLIDSTTLTAMLDEHEQKELGITNLAFKAYDPTGYGRLITYEDLVVDIVEENDTSTEQKDINLCNGGSYVVSGEFLQSLISKIDNSNANSEYYLTDIIRIASASGIRCGYIIADEAEAMGINDKIQLAEAESMVQNHLRAEAMGAGITLISPETVFLSLGTAFGKDVTISPNVVIGSGVKIGDNSEILPFSHVENVEIGCNVKIGPFARVRGETHIEDNVKIGNFVELKNAKIEEGVKAAHFSYIGDAAVGKSSNIGAGTIFCNYDGFRKHHSTIGENVFIGSNSSIISPVKIGDNAIVAAGSVVTKDVEINDLAIARSDHVNHTGKAELIRKRKALKKASPNE